MNKIVVGIDDSAGARAALRWAIEQAKLTGSTVEAVHAYDFHVAWVDEPAMHFEEWRQEAEAQARAHLNEVISDATGGGHEVPVSAVAVEGRATPTLLDASTGADLLVVGSRGRGGFAGLLLGSVSQHCAEHGRCPVVVIPTPR
jgi:nucleotide-binding universal stress UspA family protein